MIATLWPQRALRLESPGELLAEESERSERFPGVLDPVRVLLALERSGVPCMIAGWSASGAVAGKPSACWLAEIITTRPRSAARLWSNQDGPWEEAVSHGRPCIQLDHYPSRLEIYGVSHPLLRKIWKLRQIVRVGENDVALPTPEACFALRAWSIRRPDRNLPDKYMDAHHMYLLAERFPSLDERLLREFWDVVLEGSTSHIIDLFADARAGRRLEF